MILGLVTETGEFHFISDAEVQHFGSGSVSGSRFSASYTGVANFPFTLQDGSASGTGSLNGTVQERQSLTANSSFVTSNGSPINTTLSLSYNSFYERDSSLDLAAGTYVPVDTGDILSVDTKARPSCRTPTRAALSTGKCRSSMNASMPIVRNTRTSTAPDSTLP